MPRGRRNLPAVELFVVLAALLRPATTIPARPLLRGAILALLRAGDARAAGSRGRGGADAQLSEGLLVDEHPGHVAGQGLGGVGIGAVLEGAGDGGGDELDIEDAAGELGQQLAEPVRLADPALRDRRLHVLHHGRLGVELAAARRARDRLAPVRRRLQMAR